MGCSETPEGGSSPLNWMAAELEAIRQASRYRSLRETRLLPDGWALREGRRLLNLASNDYLGLAVESEESVLPELERLAEEAGADLAGGASASRLVSGHDPSYRLLEEEFARFKGTEACLVFSSGYMANAGVISAVVSRHDAVFSDKLNHASIVDGIVLSRAEHIRYRHRDLDQLESALKKADARGGGRRGQRKLIVTDAVFSMDGTIAPLADLVRLKERYGAMLMVDEAHSGGIFGSEGQGLAQSLGLTEQVDIHMGTYSKAYGACGAYVAGSRLLADYLVNKARTLIYNTGLPPVTVLWILHNVRRARMESWRRKSLLAKSGWLRAALAAEGFDVGESICQIIPVMTGDNERTAAFAARLQAAGLLAVAIRPPTVPDGTARIRLAVSAVHRMEDLQRAAEQIRDTGRELGIVQR